ncbi:MAG: PTPS-like type 4, partial [uncultured Rubrobacteraceae bacterium]
VRGIRGGRVRGGPSPGGRTLRSGGPDPRPHLQAGGDRARRGARRRRDPAGYRTPARDGGRGGRLPELPRPRRGSWSGGQEHHGRGRGGVLLGWDLTFPARPRPRLAHGARLGVAAGLRRPREGSRL